MYIFCKIDFKLWKKDFFIKKRIAEKEIFIPLHILIIYSHNIYTHIYSIKGFFYLKYIKNLIIKILTKLTLRYFLQVGEYLVLFFTGSVGYPALFFTSSVGCPALFFTGSVGCPALFFTGSVRYPALFFTGSVRYPALFFTSSVRYPALFFTSSVGCPALFFTGGMGYPILSV